MMLMKTLLMYIKKIENKDVEWNGFSYKEKQHTNAVYKTLRFICSSKKIYHTAHLTIKSLQAFNLERLLCQSILNYVCLLTCT